MLALLIFTPAAFAFLAGRFVPHEPLHGLLFLAGVSATLGAYLVFANYIPPAGLRRLVASLKTKLAKEGIMADAWDGVFVGFSPAAAPRSYELNANWDLGCLFLRSDRLCYWGEETKFSLRPDQITAIKLAPGMPGMLPPWRIYFAWKDEELGTCGVFNIGCIDGISTLRLREQSAQLAERLLAWWKATPSLRPLPAPLQALRSPEIGAVTGAKPGGNLKGGKALKELFFTAVFAMVGAILCGLPFHFLPFLFSGLYESLGRLSAIHSPGSGWYVVVVAVLVRFVAMVPVIRSKDLAIVTVVASRHTVPNGSSTEPARPASAKQAANRVLTR